MFSFPLPSIPKEAKNAPSIYPTFNVPILIRNNRLASEESKAKENNNKKQTFLSTSYVELFMSILVKRSFITVWP